MDLIKLLIVDDRPENIVALEALLKRDEIELITTTSPNEALRICWEQDIAIALIDVQMPEMDGFELVEILKSNPRTREMLVIFVTAISTETKYAVRGLSVGAVDYLYKPLDPYITSAKVDSFIQLVRYQREIKRKNEELESYQKELIKAKDLAIQGRKTKESFLANMSHEIRTPINGILGLIYLLQNSNLDDEQKRIIELLKDSSESLLGVINDILDFSKIEAGKFKIVRSETRITHVVGSVTGLLKAKADEKGLLMNVLVDENVPPLVIADALRLNQILLNLLSNAIKFTERGTVSLFVKAPESKGSLTRLQFIVKDTGIGIPADKHDRIFEIFEQANENTGHVYGGTGLGLSIVKRLAALMGGEISVESQEGVGSSFTFANWFKVVIEDADKVSVKSISALEKFDNLNILVAEDNTISQFMIRKILAGWNIKADIVENGAQVLEKINQNRYDLILMDTYMPVMGGYEATRKIRTEMPENVRNIPIISLSAAVMDDEKQEALDAGVNDILSKPFDLNALHQMIDRYIRKAD
ncbi:signal transduction histidine kinase [Arcticibacter tournemirensis]|uniref:Sensory/regulatory protein RpfC n=1 Tax=Arcticibacter tournemirensis TaxID=699437 RepID=A0A5M9HAY8_9SPHI|nr:response regulator [Arcticibacter tournemirensis]KAA8483840.1 response regulator [Arcticibacter tournemirensis]TQM49944.1 signal transduction histidine kinase [Arcticibacter tournemirensis]